MTVTKNRNFGEKFPHEGTNFHCRIHNQILAVLDSELYGERRPCCNKNLGRKQTGQGRDAKPPTGRDKKSTARARGASSPGGRGRGVVSKRKIRNIALAPITVNHWTGMAIGVPKVTRRCRAIRN